MATTATIVIEVDDAALSATGAKVTGLGSKMKTSFDAAGQASKQATDSMVEGHRKAVESANLLNDTLGWNIPRALRQVIASVPGFSAALAGAFEVTAVALFAKEIISLVADLDQLPVALYRVENTAKVAYGALSEMLGGLPTEALMEKRAQGIKDFIQSFIDQERQIRQSADSVGLEGMRALDEAHKQEVANLRNAANEAILKNRAELGDTQESVSRIQALREALNQAIMASDRKVAAQRSELARKQRDELSQYQQTAELVGLSELATIQERSSFEKIEIDLRRDLNNQQKESLKLAVDTRVAHEETVKRNEAEVAGVMARLQAEASTAYGIEAIRRELAVREAQIDETDRLSGINHLNERLAAEGQADSKIAELRRQAIAQTEQMEREAALAMLPPWERSYAQIAEDAEDRLRQVRVALERTEITAEDAAARIAAIQAEEFAHMRDQLAGDMESLFDDIVSGNIGKTFLKQFEHLVFQMVATWALGLKSMQSASAQTMGSGSGGLLGTIFGGIFGGGSGGSGASASTPPFVAPGLSFLGNGTLPLSSNTGIPDLSSVIPLSGGGGASNSGSQPAGSKAAGVAGSAATSGLGALLAKVFPGSITIGGHKISGPTLAAIGATLGMDGLSRVYNANGLGGHILGSLESIAGGAAIGTSILPGIGTAIGAAVGGIAALFGWIFGSGKKKKARQDISDQLRQQLQMVDDEYSLHTLDYNTGRSQLEQIRQQYAQAEAQVGGKESDWVDPWVDQEIQKMNTMEAERQRRAALQFGAAQFRVGGFVSPSLAATGAIPSLPSALHFGGGGAVPAILHAGEFVFRPEAVQRYGKGRLQAMNDGTGGGDTHYHFAKGSINALDAQSFVEYMRRVRSEGWRGVN
jgi:gas vesicle protein